MYLVYSRPFISVSFHNISNYCLVSGFESHTCFILPSLNSLSVIPYLISLYDYIYEISVPHSPAFIYILRAFICHLCVHIFFSVSTGFLI